MSYGHRELVAQPHTWLLRIGWTLGLPPPSKRKPM
jgi:hypothetical protein